MATKHDLKHSILSILKHNKDGSFQTQGNRKTQLIKIGNDLLAEGFYLRSIHQLKAKHIYHLLAMWKNAGLGVGTIKNRLVNIRWLCEKINKPGLIPADNGSLKIAKRQYVTNQDKSITLQKGDMTKIDDENVKMSLRLQECFGLRKEESIKIKIHEADKGDRLSLKGSWCKNGRPRDIAIRTSEQRAVIEACMTYIGNTYRSLIPTDKNYYQQMKKYENELAKAGIHKAHGLRHAYAQQRYIELTGWNPPAKNGSTRKELTQEQLIIDKEARQIITVELGHERLSVLAIYLGA